MDNELTMPLVELGPDDDADPGTFGSAVPLANLPKPENYAEDEKVKSEIQQEIIPVVQWCRTNRITLESEWQAIRRLEYMMHDEGRKYYGRSDAYLPIAARIFQTVVSTLARGLFPSDEYFDVSLRGMGDPETVKPIKTYLQWEMDNADVRSAIKPFLRQFVLFGTGVLKFWYDKKARTEGRLDKYGESAYPTFRPIRKDGLAVKARSLLHWYMYPITADDMSQATIAFEDMEVSRGFILEMIRKGRWKNGTEALNAPPIPNYQVDQADQVTNITGLTPPTQNVLGGTRVGDIRTLTEVWTFMKLPAGAYLDFEDKEDAIPVRILLAGTTPVVVTRNPFWHQRPPYLVGRANAQPGMFYGYNVGRIVRTLQYLSNDFANQTNDCGNFILNPIFKVNPGALTGPLRPISPGVAWYMTDTDGGVRTLSPDVGLIQAGLMMLQQWGGMAQDMGGAPPIMQGTNSSRNAKTATGAQILQRNAFAPLQDVVEDLERDVMVPLLEGAWILGQQFRDQAIMARVAGEQVQVDPSDLAGDVFMRWLASSQAVNQAQRAQQAIMLLQTVLPVVPLLNQLGYVVDPSSLIKRVYADGFGFRDFNSFIRPQMMQGLQPGGAMPQAAQPQDTSNIRSAVDQAGNGQQELQPGEGDDFADIRGQADALAALSGRGAPV